MASMMGSRSKFYFHNNMVCLLKALEGKYITVEIRNDIVVVGKLQEVGPQMNLTLTNVTWTNVRGVSSRFSQFFVKGRQIRYVHIPDEVDIVKAMQWEVNKTNYFQQKMQTKMRKQMQRREEKSRKQMMKSVQERREFSSVQHRQENR